MKWRCLNDAFGYCSGIPEHKDKPGLTNNLAFFGGKCKLDPKDCGKHQLLSEQEAGIRLSGNYRHTQVGKKKAKKGSKK